MSLKDEIEYEISAQHDQGGESWLKAREGKITASEVHKIMADVKREMSSEEYTEYKKVNPKGTAKQIVDDTLLSDAAIKYLSECAWERITGQRIDSAETYAMKYGTEQEPDARNMFSRVYKKEISLKGFVRWDEEPEFVGGSSDGIVEADKAILEIKCALNGGNHIEYSRYKTLSDLPTAYMWQVVMNMMITGNDKCYFISYDPRMKTEAQQLRVIKIERDAKLEAKLRVKLRAAVRMLQEICDEFLKPSQ